MMGILFLAASDFHLGEHFIARPAESIDIVLDVLDSDATHAPSGRLGSGRACSLLATKLFCLV